MSEREGAGFTDLAWLQQEREREQRLAGDFTASHEVQGRHRDAANRYERIIVSVRRSDVFRQTATEQLAVASRLAQEAQQVRDVLRRIKNLVCGEKNPRWADQWATINTRGAIADLCDSVLSQDTSNSSVT